MPETSLTLSEARDIVGGLSKPSKMPWWSWSLSAAECPIGSKLRQIPGSTCASCYALKGNYVFPNVVAAHERRRASLEDPRFVEAFAFLLNTLHSQVRRERRPGVPENRFRWFDAGDLPDLETLEKINRIAELTPAIDHWLPTREVPTVRAFLQKHGSFAPNLVVRISTPMVGDRLTQGVVSTVGRDDPDLWQCPAASQGNQCRQCDKCWTDASVNYPLH